MSMMVHYEMLVIFVRGLSVATMALEGNTTTQQLSVEVDSKLYRLTAIGFGYAGLLDGKRGRAWTVVFSYESVERAREDRGGCGQRDKSWLRCKPNMYCIGI